MNAAEWLFIVGGILAWVMLIGGLYLSAPQKLKRECRDLILVMHVAIVLMAVIGIIC